MTVVADPGLYCWRPIQPAAEPRLFVVYGSDAVLVPIPVQQAEERPQLRVVGS